jgi:peptide/nickel transport system ATP-binding protein
MSKDQNTDSSSLLDVKNLYISYKTRKGLVPAVQDLSFHLNRGETLGMVGESGCGKSTVAFGIVNFLGANGRIPGGSICFEGQELVGRPERELNKIRGDRISMVYQDPMAALNPVVPIGDQLIEVLTAHRDITKTEAWDRCVEMLKRVYMPDAGDVMRRFTFQLSGGQQQRVVIAMAMLNNPSLLIMDEPTTALDVTVEAAVLDLVGDLKTEFDTGILFISHNLGVISRVCDRVCVMYAGQGVEQATIQDLFKNPTHPYTHGLLSCVPKLGKDKASSILYPIPGRVPPPVERPDHACVFEPRCDYSKEQCLQARPGYTEVEPGHVARCALADELFGHFTATPENEKKATHEVPNTIKDEKILSLDHLKVYYEQESKSLASFFGMAQKQYVKAVDDISFEVKKGKTLGIVGESGCGKSTMVKGLIGLEEITEGKAEFLDLDISQPITKRDKAVIREIQMVFQNPDSTMNPAYTVGQQIARPIKLFSTVPKNKVREEVIRLLRAVRLGSNYFDRYPRQLSGGEKQRVGIARALASRPDLVICDEPVSALDVSVQAAVLNLLLEIQRDLSTTLLFIAHDLSVVRFFSDDVAIMYLGQIMEIGPVDKIYSPPYHPYTEALLSAVPFPDPNVEQSHIRLSGNVPSALNPPKGCRFHTRCPRREILPDGGKVCEEKIPPWRETEEGHKIFCHIPLEQLREFEDVLKVAQA